MKNFVFITVLILTSLVFSNAHIPPVDSGAPAEAAVHQAEIRFDEDSHNFGEIIQGTSVSFIFKCKNTGNKPLLITWVDTPCGCTTKEWTKSPIYPGRTGQVIVTYNSAGRNGSFNKTITVLSNATTGQVLLSVKGTVVKPNSQ